MADAIIWLIVLLLVLLFGSIFVLLYTSGLLHNINVCLTDDVPFVGSGALFFYKTNKGSYNSVGNIYTEVYSLAPMRLQCGIYYDDPEEVSGDQCRSAIGAILKEDDSIADELQRNSFGIFHIPSTKAACYAQFPHSSFLSILIGIWRVYPAIRKYASEAGLQIKTIIEVYDEQQIHYIGITDNASNYLVKEFHEDPLESEEENVDEQGVEKSFEKVYHKELGDFPAELVVNKIGSDEIAYE